MPAEAGHARAFHISSTTGFRSTPIRGVLPAILDRVLSAGTLEPPDLVVAGRQDFVRSPAATEGLAKLIPGAQFVTIAPGHFMPTTSPEVLVRVLRDFWNI